MIGCIIQARMGSTRLPGKVLKKIENDNTVIDYVLKQMSFCKKIDKIIVATTTLDEDDKIFYHIKNKVNVFRGSSEDVLDRYFRCASENKFSVIVRITADNPLIDPEIVDLIVKIFEEKKCDFATNTIFRTFPYGTEVEVFTYKILKESWQKAEKPSEREHVTPYMRNPENKFNLENIEYSENFSLLRYTIDRQEDFETVKEIIKNIHSRPILLRHIIQLNKLKPEIFKINKKIKHDGYISALSKDEQFLKLKKGEDNETN